MREITQETPKVDYSHKVTVEMTVLEAAMIASVLAKKRTNDIAEDVAREYGNYVGELVKVDNDPSYVLYAGAAEIVRKYIEEAN